jgi:hypothetical protein
LKISTKDSGWIFSEENLDSFNNNQFKADIKVFFIPSGYELTVDFNQYKTENHPCFFLPTSI